MTEGPMIQIWQETPGYERELSAARKRLQEVLDEYHFGDEFCSKIDKEGLRFDLNADPEVRLVNARDPEKERVPETLAGAIELASKYGRSRWWTLDELDGFADREGDGYQKRVLFECAMWEMGYARKRGRHKIKLSGWKNIGKRDKDPVLERDALRYSEHATNLIGASLYAEPCKSEKMIRWAELFPELWINLEEVGGEKKYRLGVGRSGKIYIAEGEDARDFKSVRHFLREQSEFRISQDVVLRSKMVSYGERKGVLIEAMEGHHIRKRLARCIWPAEVSGEGLSYLRKDLAKKLSEEMPF